MTINTDTSQPGAAPDPASRRKGSVPAEASAKGRTGKRNGNGQATKQASEPGPAASPAATVTKLDLLLALLTRDGGATLAELSEATGWQVHSVRGAMAGTLKRKGHVVTSEKVDGIRRYRAGPAS